MCIRLLALVSVPTSKRKDLQNTEGFRKLHLMEEGIPAALRRDRTLGMVRDREFVRVADLSSIFGISEVTARADLAFLADQGLLQRVHGGAIIRDPERQVERSFEEALDEYSAEKIGIGRAAANVIRSGETAILDVGTSTAALARAIVAREDLVDVTVFTSSLTNALELEPAIPRISVVLTGGEPSSQTAFVGRPDGQLRVREHPRRYRVHRL